MAITRSVWIDDDGTGTTGTILNNAELQKIYNNIDAMPTPVIGTVRYGPPATFAMAAGAHNALRPPAGTQSVLWLLEPAGAVTINGILAEPDQTQHLLFNRSGYAVTITNSSGSAAVGDGIICPGLVNYALPLYGCVPVLYVAALGVWILVGKA
jgi:hypothetical protein